MSPVLSTPKAIVARRDAEYFVDATFVVFEVEGVLFRVPTYAFITESEHFAKTFPFPQENDNTKASSPGSSVQYPLKLPEEIKSEDFKCLLKLLYPLNPFANPTISTVTPRLSKDEWTSVLKLSTEWRFLNIRNVALQALQTMKRSPTEKIVLGRTLKISKWVLEGYKELANTDDTTSITNEQAATIGWEVTVKLHQIREEQLRNKDKTFEFTSPSGSNSPTPVFSFSTRKENKSVEDIFKDELSSIRTEELVFRP